MTWPTRRSWGCLRIAGSRPRTNAALQAANLAIACSGYRVTARSGHHKVTLEATRLALGVRADGFADCFETCRRKRNVIDCTRSHVATETEAAEILQKATEFYELVEGWISSGFHELKR